MIRFDPGTDGTRPVETGSSIDALAATEEDVWLADAFAGTITRLDPDSLEVAGDPIVVDGSIDQIAASGEHAWVLDQQLGSITRIDAGTGQLRSQRVGEDPTEMAVTEDAVWVGDRDRWLYEVDAVTLERSRHRAGAEVLCVDVDDAAETPWVYVGYPVAQTAD